MLEKLNKMSSRRVNVHREHIKHKRYRQLGLSEHLEIMQSQM